MKRTNILPHSWEKKTHYYLSYENENVNLHILNACPEGTYRLEVSDNHTQKIFYQGEVSVLQKSLYHYLAAYGNSWYTQYLSRVYFNNVLDYEELLDLRGKNVFIEQLQPALGDTICSVPHIFEFQKQHQCKVEAFFGYSGPTLFELYNDTENVKFVKQPTGHFIKYRVNLNHKRVPSQLKLGEVITDALGIEYQDRIYDFTSKAQKRNIEGKYVCIAPVCVRQDKRWHWKNGGMEAWQQVVDFLNGMGYKVVVISKEEFKLKHVIDKTGQIPLRDRVTDLVHSEFFIGLSSALSWLAHGCKKYVFMLIGAIAEWHEFGTNVCKIYDHNATCLGCGNNPDTPWRGGECALEKNYECTRFLDPMQVISEIEERIKYDIIYDKWNIVNEKKDIIHQSTKSIS